MSQSIAVIGEVMLELAPTDTSSSQQTFKLGFAGDTFNTAVYMRRAGQNCSYVTRLGDDKHSKHIVDFLNHEQIDTQLITEQKDAAAGLYMINNLPCGEREFYYWRGQSPAKKLLADGKTRDELFQQLHNFDYLYLSAISVAILEEETKPQLLAFLQEYKARGGKIIYDSNFRARLWSNHQQIKEYNQALLELSHTALLTLEDEQQIWKFDQLQEYLDFYQRAKIPEVVIKRGGDDVIVCSEGEISYHTVPAVEKVIDTTAAGDSFNGAYIAARLAGKEIDYAVQQANSCAASVIQFRGALLPTEQAS